MTLLRECPRCKKKNDQELKECIDCGIVFEEYFKKRKKRLEEVQNIVSNGRFDEAIMYLTKIQNEYPEISAKCKENITILKNKKLKVPASDGRDLLDELIREFKVKKSNKLRKKFEALAIECNGQWGRT